MSEPTSAAPMIRVPPIAPAVTREDSGLVAPATRFVRRPPSDAFPAAVGSVLDWAIDDWANDGQQHAGSLYFAHAEPCKSNPWIIFVHGAGMSAASWEPCVKQLVALNPAVNCVTYDLRGHGRSTAEPSETISLSRNDLVNDLAHIVTALGVHFALSVDSDAPSLLFLVGHSLGGAICGAFGQRDDFKHRIGGVVMVDIVEETARHSIQFMHGFLHARPTRFTSERECEVWFVQHGGMKSMQGAVAAVPSILVRADAAGSFVWRTNLPATEEFWEGWFEDVDGNFLTMPCPKLLLLANTDRLDRTMTIAQMQGKFQLEVVTGVGHYVMLDDPTAVATKIGRFVGRVDQLSRKLPMSGRRGSAAPPVASTA